MMDHDMLRLLIILGWTVIGFGLIIMFTDRSKK